jgi:hypothetical protein
MVIDMVVTMVVMIMRVDLSGESFCNFIQQPLCTYGLHSINTFYKKRNNLKEAITQDIKFISFLHSLSLSTWTVLYLC